MPSFGGHKILLICQIENNIHKQALKSGRFKIISLGTKLGKKVQKFAFCLVFEGEREYIRVLMMG